MLNKNRKKTDRESLKAEKDLIDFSSKQVKELFKEILSLVEIKFGKEFDGYKEVRAKILRSGNDCIRDISDKIVHDFNVEKVFDSIKIINRNGK